MALEICDEESQLITIVEKNRMLSVELFPPDFSIPHFLPEHLLATGRVPSQSPTQFLSRSNDLSLGHFEIKASCPNLTSYCNFTFSDPPSIYIRISQSPSLGKRGPPERHRRAGI